VGKNGGKKLNKKSFPFSAVYYYLFFAFYFREFSICFFMQTKEDGDNLFPWKLTDSDHQ
jgi:hypothetical protein